MKNKTTVGGLHFKRKTNFCISIMRFVDTTVSYGLFALPSYSFLLRSKMITKGGGYFQESGYP